MRQQEVLRLNSLRRSIVVVLGLALLGGLWSIALDWDHIFQWVLHVKDPLSLSGFEGRPYHTVFGFLVQSVLLACITVALILRWNDVE
jgi:hypothetical protein